MLYPVLSLAFWGSRGEGEEKDSQKVPERRPALR